MQDSSESSTLQEFIRFATVGGTLLTLISIAIYLMAGAFDRCFEVGIRSLAAVVFPIVAGSFIFLFRRDWLNFLVELPVLVSFAASLAAGIGIMWTLAELAGASAVPVAELLVSACIGVLTFSPGSLHGLGFTAASLHGDRALAYYFGIASGMLLYVILLGFPVVPAG